MSSELRLDADRIAQALSRTCAPFRRATAIDLTFARFQPFYDTAEKKWKFRRHGRVVTTSLAAWVAERKQCADMPYPVEGEKGSLPAEIGALLADADGRGPRRRNRDVVACDSGASPNALCEELHQIQSPPGRDPGAGRDPGPGWDTAAGGAGGTRSAGPARAKQRRSPSWRSSRTRCKHPLKLVRTAQRQQRRALAADGGSFGVPDL